MLIDFPGVMTEFADLEAGEFFVFFEDKHPVFAMKVYDASDPKRAAAMSFSSAVDPTTTPPTILSSQQFRSRAVCVVRGVVIRPTSQIAKLRDGSPSTSIAGPIIFATDGVFIRAWPPRGQGTIDVDLKSGAADASGDHPGSLWAENWEIILIGRSSEIVLCECGQPAAS